jgi:hypothetical protein
MSTIFLLDFETVLTVWYFDSVIFWQCDILTMWYFDSVIFWQCDILTMWYFDSVIFWQCDILTVWYFDSVIYWQCDILTVCYLFVFHFIIIVVLLQVIYYRWFIFDIQNAKVVILCITYISHVFWPLCYLPFLDLLILIAPLMSSISSLR